MPIGNVRQTTTYVSEGSDDMVSVVTLNGGFERAFVSKGRQGEVFSFTLRGDVRRLSEILAEAADHIDLLTTVESVRD